jgi:hypothetical protein
MMLATPAKSQGCVLAVISGHIKHLLISENVARDVMLAISQHFDVSTEFDRIQGKKYFKAVIKPKMDKSSIE